MGWPHENTYTNINMSGKVSLVRSVYECTAPENMTPHLQEFDSMVSWLQSLHIARIVL